MSRRTRIQHILLTSHIVPVLFLLVLGGVTHAVNMFNYPYYESDEGTYSSQGWSIVREGTLAPYTYWYDHPPMGWVAIAGWYGALGGDVFAFGTSIDTARVLMLLVYLATLITIYWLAYRVTDSKLAAVVACSFYALAPLGLYFRRRVLLDNFMTLWLMLSFVPLLLTQPKLRHFALSGVFYGLAFLTKISAAVWGPALLYLVYARKYLADRTFRVATWLFFSIGLTSLYIIYALMKSEFFPSGWFGDAEHVSLLETLAFQMGRGSDLPFYHPGSDFYTTYFDWVLRDPFALAAILISLIGGAVLFRYRPLVRPFLIASLLYIVFLMRGGVVLNFYILPLMATVTVLGAATMKESFVYIGALFQRLFAFIQTNLPPLLAPAGRILVRTGPHIRVALLCAMGLLAFMHYGTEQNTKYMRFDEVSPQREAMHWVKTQLPEDATLIVDNTMLVELKDPNYINDKVFEDADWFYKVSNDPSIRFGKYNDNWRSFDYIVLTHEMLKQIERFPEENIIRQTFENSLPAQKWIRNSSSFIDEQKLITTNGDWAMVFAVNGTTKSQLVESWNTYRDEFIFSYGQVIDPQTELTTSEGQSYAMLRAAWMNDREAFNGAWLWTQHHLQHRLSDKLISWKWKDDEMLDPTNAADADLDIALALLFAHKVWQDESYKEAALEIIQDIWRQEVVEVNGTLYLLAMDSKSSERYRGRLVNPSYFSPAHYRVFAEVDPEHDWERLADDTYRVLERLRNSTDTGLPANWYLLQDDTGRLISAEEDMGQMSSYYGYDAFRTLWRVGLDAQWYDTPEAERYLASMYDTLERYDTGGMIPTEIDTRTGAVVTRYPSLATQVGYLIALTQAPDIEISGAFYNNVFEVRYDEEAHIWGSAENYYDQNWAWFGIGLFNNDLPNLWEIL